MISVKKGKVFASADAVRLWTYRQAAVFDQRLAIDFDTGGDAIADAVWKTVNEFLNADGMEDRDWRDNHTVVGLHDAHTEGCTYFFFHDCTIYVGTKVVPMDGATLPEPIEATRFSRSNRRR